MSESRKSKMPAPNALDAGPRASTVQIDPDMVVKEWKPPEVDPLDPSDMMGQEEPVTKETYGLKGSPSSQLRMEEQRRKTEYKRRESVKRLSRLKAKEEERAKEARASKIKAQAAAAAAAEAARKPSVYPQDARASETPSFTPSAGIASPPQRPSIQSERPSTVVQRPSQLVAATTRPSRLLLGSIMAGRRGSLGEERTKGPKYAPTYRMESKNPFKAWQVRKVLEELMQNSCRMKRYDSATASKKAISLAGDIRAAVRSLNYDRYKICVKVDIGQKWDQGVSSACRFLWDVEKDDFAFYVCENSIMYIIASVFGLYYD